MTAVHDKTVTSSSQSSLTTSTFGIAGLLMAGWRPEAYVFVLMAARRPEEAYDICCWLLGVRKRLIFCCWRPGAGILAFMQSGCLLHEAGFQQQRQQQHTNHLPSEPVGGCPDPPATVMPGSGFPFRPAAETHKPNTRRCSEVVPLNIAIVCSRPQTNSQTAPHSKSFVGHVQNNIVPHPSGWGC